MARRAASEALPGAPDPWAPSEMPAFRSKPPYRMTEMIAAEPALAERLLGRLRSQPAFEELASAIGVASAAGQPVIVTGCGTSEHAAMAIAALLTEGIDPVPGREVHSAQAMELLHRPIGGGLLIGVSHEGGTAMTNAALRAAGEAGARTALITVSAGSPGAELADIVVTTDEQDQSWCHTVGYLSPLLVGVALSAKLAERRLDILGIRSLLDGANDPHAAATVAAALVACDRILVTGTGVDHVSARELALKIAEGARLPADAHELETLHHGHLAAATRWTGLIVLLTASSPIAAVRERADRLLAAAASLSVPAAAIVSAEVTGGIGSELTPAGRIVLPRAGRTPGSAPALLGAAMSLQLLAERMARARGVDPDTLGREDPAQAAAHG
ncbi:MAG: SIS domain-containing protein [Chloroflexi bacterium]|nr:SIS domain-containing protein [Chloroflexota bacterium]